MHCTPARMTIGELMIERNAVNDCPVYQRESGAWSKEKKQLFLDSLFNRYDVPKVYFHDLRGTDPRFKYSVIDGKQRLNCIWEFLNGNVHLADDLVIYEPEGRVPPKKGANFLELTPDWQEIFKSRGIDVVLVQNATEEDIEDLFSRLNNGEPLNAAEKRNAMGGDMCELIRDATQHSFFKEKLRFASNRYSYLEVAAKFLHIESSASKGGDVFVDLKKKYLDDMVRTRKQMSEAEKKGLMKRVTDTLNSLNRLFSNNDPLLNKQAYPPMYYLFIKVMIREYAHEQLFARLKAFLPVFQTKRQQNLQLDENSQEPKLIEFGRLIQQGTNDLNSLKERVSILRRYFILENPDVSVRDKIRTLSLEERYVVWVLAGRKCVNCNCELHSLEEMQADHITQWAHGGETKLSNARSLCESCNQELSRGVS